MTYKRNQIEEAIARLFDPNCQHPSSDLRMRIRRLLELDRAAGRKIRSKDAVLRTLPDDCVVTSPPNFGLPSGSQVSLSLMPRPDRPIAYEKCWASLNPSECAVVLTRRPGLCRSQLGLTFGIANILGRTHAQ
jgi:hypothetical protein